MSGIGQSLRSRADRLHRRLRLGLARVRLVDRAGLRFGADRPGRLTWLVWFLPRLPLFLTRTIHQAHITNHLAGRTFFIFYKTTGFLTLRRVLVKSPVTNTYVLSVHFDRAALLRAGQHPDQCPFTHSIGALERTFADADPSGSSMRLGMTEQKNPRQPLAIRGVVKHF